MSVRTLFAAAMLGVIAAAPVSTSLAQTEGQQPSNPAPLVTPAPVVRSVAAMAGVETRIGVYVNVKPDCSSGPLPTIRVLKSPEHGSIVVKRARLQLTNVGSCLSVTVPGYAAFYKARPGHIGSDTLRLEIVNESGTKQEQTINLNVRGETRSL